jgi:hypothetical protein
METLTDELVDLMKQSGQKNHYSSNGRTLRKNA